MNVIYDYVAFAAIICSIISLIVTFILRGLKKRTLANVFELVAVIFLVVYSAKFTYLFGNIIDLDFPDDYAAILFFLLTLALVIYKVIHFVRYR